MYLKKTELGTSSSFYIFCIDTYGSWQCTVVIVVMASSQSLEKVTRGSSLYMYHTRQYSNGNSSVMIARFERIVSSEVYLVE